MKLIALAAALILAAPLRAQAPPREPPIWTVLAKSHEAVVEIDRHRIRRLSNTLADAWTRVTYATPDTTDDGQFYQQFVQHAIYDCARRRYLAAQLIIFDRTGRIIKVVSRSRGDWTDADWRPAPNESVADAQLRGACDGTSA